MLLAPIVEKILSFKIQSKSKAAVWPTAKHKTKAVVRAILLLCMLWPTKTGSNIANGRLTRKKKMLYVVFAKKCDLMHICSA